MVIARRQDWTDKVQHDGSLADWMAMLASCFFYCSVLSLALSLPNALYRTDLANLGAETNPMYRFSHTGAVGLCCSTTERVQSTEAITNLHASSFFHIIEHDGVNSNKPHGTSSSQATGCVSIAPNTLKAQPAMNYLRIATPLDGREALLRMATLVFVDRNSLWYDTRGGRYKPKSKRMYGNSCR